MASDVIIPDAYWIRGINSLLEPTLLREGEYQWGVNIDNAGGIIKTRQGFNRASGVSNTEGNRDPRGMAIFKNPVNGVSAMVVVARERIFASPYPFKNWIQLGTGLGVRGPVN